MKTRRKKWLEVEVCLMKVANQKKKSVGLLSVNEVNMINMTIKVNTVLVSSSPDSNVSTKRYGPVIIYWQKLTTDAFAYCMPSLDEALLVCR